MSNIKNNTHAAPSPPRLGALLTATHEAPSLRWLHTMSHLASRMTECSVIAHWQRRGLQAPQLAERR